MAQVIWYRKFDVVWQICLRQASNGSLEIGSLYDSMYSGLSDILECLGRLFIYIITSRYYSSSFSSYVMLSKIKSSFKTTRDNVDHAN